MHCTFSFMMQFGDNATMNFQLKLTFLDSEKKSKNFGEVYCCLYPQWGDHPLISCLSFKPQEVRKMSLVGTQRLNTLLLVERGSDRASARYILLLLQPIKRLPFSYSF